MKIRDFIIIISLIFFLNGSLAANYNRDKVIQPEKVMDIIGVKKGMVIGISGAGKGYFTFKMSKRVGRSGRIYANEINKNNLDYIKRKSRRKNINNIFTILGEVEDPLFPHNKMDMVFMCYVFHDLEKPVEFLRNIKSSLKPGATLVILDQVQEKTGNTHFYTKKELIRIIREADYRIKKIETFLKKENIYICVPKNKY